MRQEVLQVDVQLRRGLLDVCVLKSLESGDSYGYQIIKDVSPHIEISESTLYPILKRLESEHCLTAYSVEHRGRLRKYYRITQDGENKIEEFLVGWADVMRAYQFISGCEDE